MAVYKILRATAPVAYATQGIGAGVAMGHDPLMGKEERRRGVRLLCAPVTSARHRATVRCVISRSPSSVRYGDGSLCRTCTLSTNREYAILIFETTQVERGFGFPSVPARTKEKGCEVPSSGSAYWRFSMMPAWLTSSCAMKPIEASMARRPCWSSLVCISANSAASVGLRPAGSKLMSPG